MPALLLAHLAALALCWWAPRFWAAQDARAFAANGSADSLHGVFHRQRATWRAGFGLLVALVASEPAHRSLGAFACSCAALLAIGAAYFFYDFNPRLNRARGLAYVGPYYVSFDPNAARFPDRWLAARAYRACPVYGGPGGDDEHTQQLRQAYAAQKLQQLGRWVLETGALLYALLLATSLVLLCAPQ